MPSSAIHEATRRDWRELGYYYDRDDSAKTWRLLGTPEGLLGFVASLRAYAGNESNNRISEHEHFGPYWYLEVGTWHAPVISDHWIAGPLSALSELASHIEAQLAVVQAPDVVRVRHAFAPTSPYEFQLELQPAGFDPALADPACNPGEA
jgi:hypothetical protein